MALVAMRGLPAKVRLLRAFIIPTVLLWGSVAVAQSRGPANLRMGNPSGAKDEKDNFLMDKDFFTLSYNNTKGTPNWVSWRLAKEDLGKAPRKPFHPDEDLPKGFKQVVPADYSGSGFDRGHMCDHSDRAKTDESSTATFVMTNMVPQSPQNNQKGWAQLEDYCRRLVSRGKVCYIVAGPEGQGGTGRSGFKKVTPRGGVMVPAVTWKVIMVLDKDVDDPSTIDRKTHIRLIGVIVPNDTSVGDDWSGFRVPVKQIEEVTGYTFFDKVPDAVIGHLKAEVDEVPISDARTPRGAADGGSDNE